MATDLGVSTRRTSGRNSSRPPTKELGAQMQVAALPPWSTLATDEQEETAEWMFPNSVRTAKMMMNDSQIDGLYSGATWPIRRYKWMINPNGAERDRVEDLQKDINLPIKGDPPSAIRGRSKRRFVHDKHMEDALRSLQYGFYAFEQVGVIGDDGKWHLRKLAPRPPYTVQDFDIAEDGGIILLRQNVSSKPLTQGRVNEIPVDRLVVYTWDKEGANWYGRSMLRSIYRNWLIKDRLLRVDAIKHERNGVGTPVATGAPGMTDIELAELAKLAQSFKAGEAAGGAIPAGTELHLKGTEGSIPDTLASINAHDEAMSRRFLMMFLQLGSTLHGSRALGKDFVDYFQLAQEHIANWYAGIFNEHVIEDYWDWNYGEEEDKVPFITYERDDDPRFAVADLALMIQNNVVQVDDELEQAVREAMDLPEKDESSIRVPVDVTATPPGDQPGQPSTQPGNADPQFPDQNPATMSKPRRRAAVLSSPATSRPPASNGIAEWSADPSAV